MSTAVRALVAVVAAVWALGLIPSMPGAAQQEEGSERQAVRLRAVAEGLTAPVHLTTPEDGSGRLFIVDQVGVVRVVGKDGQLLEKPFLDLREKIVELRDDFDERGLLGLAFHPDFKQNGNLYVYYSAPRRSGAPRNFDHTSHVSELTLNDPSSNTADVGTERIILQVDQPQFNHNAGHIAFGPDGYLYIPLGDGGGANDVGTGHVQGGNGQDLSQLLGKILRIDVNGQQPYAIPSDNPFRERQGARPEIWAYGLRNPYDISFDRGGDRQLFIADAGQNLYEEIDVGKAGANYGWPIKEATECFNQQEPSKPPQKCPSESHGDELVDPVVQYTHDFGLVTVGGRVYRGDDIRDLQGKYVFGDWSKSFQEPDGTLFVAEGPEGVEGAELWDFSVLDVQVEGEAPGGDTPTATAAATTEASPAGEPGGTERKLGRYVLGFGQDDEGEVYVLTSRSTAPAGSTGVVYKMEPAAAQEGEGTGARRGEDDGGTASWWWIALVAALLLAIALIAVRAGRTERS